MRKSTKHSFEPHLAALRRLAHRLLRSSTSADDVVQEACLAALLRPKKPNEFGPWLASTARHLACDLRHSESHRRERERRAARPEGQPSTADLLIGHEVLQELHAAVHRLQEPYRSAIRRRFFDDQSAHAIASGLSLPLNTVRTHLRRGLQRLRRDLDGSSRGGAAIVGDAEKSGPVRVHG
jgi:RNA polymerase sigma-70 factor (ECF subfamily)